MSELLALSPRDQLRAGRMPCRLFQLWVGLTLYGASMAMLLRRISNWLSSAINS